MPSDVSRSACSARTPSHVTASAPTGAAADGLRRDAARELVWCGTVGVVLVGAVVPWCEAELRRAVVAAALLAFAAYGVACALIWRGLRWHAPHPRFGAANRVTLLRLGWALALGAVALVLARAESGSGLYETSVARHHSSTLAWAVVGVATLAALLDLLDGALARKHRLTSRFGARFDMECDALLIAVLSVLVVQLGKAGVWVCVAGALRYGFVAAARRWPWLAQPLPPSTRRQAACVTQIATLIAALAPVVPTPWSALLAGVGLLTLVASFTWDVLALRRTHVATASATAAPAAFASASMSASASASASASVSESESAVASEPARLLSAADG